MASYSAFHSMDASNDELAWLLFSPELSLLPPPPPLRPMSPPTFRHHSHNRSRSTLAMLMGSDDDAMRCRYPSKLCRHARVRKASGELHRYCAYHRDKANANQKRWVDRQREGPGSGSGSPTESSSPISIEASASFATQTKYQWILAAAASATPPSDTVRDNTRERETRRAKQAPASSAGAGILSDDDWDALFSLLVPSQPSCPASRCDQQRRATSSSMPSPCMSKGTY